MIEAVHHYEGTVNQVMGDGIMALFGAPLAHEDHAVRACYAALRMQDAHPTVLGGAAADTGDLGKSRLFYEFVHSHHAHGWLTLESGSVSYGKATPYLPLTDLLRAYFRIDRGDDGRAIQAKVTGNVLTLDETLRDAIPAVLWLLDALPGGSSFLALDPTERRRRTLAAVKALLLRESRVQPLIVVFEDLHWIDSETQEFLDRLVESLPAAPILLAVNYRPEYRHGWGSKTYYRQLRIDLPGPDSADDLDALLGSDPSVATLKPLLIARTEGNPLFLEEGVRALVETGALAGTPGAYRFVKSPDAVAVPATVQAILAARIDRLAPEDKRLLQAAAVVGKDVPLALLLAVAELDEDDLRRGLGRLQAAEFLYEARLFPEVEYTFKHALTHEVAYGSLLSDRRQALHAALVGAVERLHADRLEEHVERLAHHALRGHLRERAVGYLQQAGDRAAARSGNREAAALFEQALAVLPWPSAASARSAAWSCERPWVSPACWPGRGDAGRPAGSWPRSMPGSRKATTPPTSALPGRCWPR